MKPEPVEEPPSPDPFGLFAFSSAMFGTTLGEAVMMLRALGLSHQTNFDKVKKSDTEVNSRDLKLVKRYGLTGITKHGARRIRCACHLLQKEGGKRRLVFATATVPPLPIEDLERLHQSWHKVVDAYRRKLTRALKDNGLRGEVAMVTEVQEKRHESSGVPILHIHSVFIGRRAHGKWAISTKRHDEIWGSALNICIGGPIPKLRAACNLQRVKYSAESYLAKYVSKGVKAVQKLVLQGFERWLPKQWWGCTRTLTKRIDEQTRHIDDLAEWLDDVAEVEGGDVWIWHRTITLKVEGRDPFKIARYGRLGTRTMAQIQRWYPPPKNSQIAY